MIQNFIRLIEKKNEPFIIFDVGSRDCQQSIEFYNWFPNAKIYAFECNPNTIPLCRKNIEPYSDRITLIEGAVCDYDGDITFFPINQEKTLTTWKDGNPGASSLFKSNGTYTEEQYVQDEINTNCHRLDTIMDKHSIQKVDIIWMDLQGAELLALKGLGMKLENVQYIHTEVSHKEMYSGQVMYQELNTYILSKQFTLLNNLSLQGWQEDAIYKKTLFNEYDLTSFKRDKHSQRGHDGIIEKIMKELQITKGFFIEFGGWDGIYLSNCRNLFENGWNGSFIEANQTKYLQLVDNYKNTDVIPINAMVYPTHEEGDTIDSLHETFMNKVEVDLLSIDIDGRDYEILEHLKLKPKLIIIEGGFLFHPCLKTKIPYDIAKNNVQQPVAVLIELAKEKGYVPICFNQDTFLLRVDLYQQFEYFRNIKNDAISLWNSGYQNILSRQDREWLTNTRFNHGIVRRVEHPYFMNIEHSIRNAFDIVIPVGPNDIDIIEKQIQYTKKNIIGYRNIYIISYLPTLHVDGCITINENLFPFNLEMVTNLYGKEARNNWYLQQLLKLYSGFVIPDILDKYLIIDCDTFFLKPTTFVHDDKCLYNYSDENHIPYFEHMTKLDREFIKMDMSKSGICHHMIFEKQYVKEMIERVEKTHNIPFYMIFLQMVTDVNGSGASEYELYFNYILKFHNDKIKIRQLNWANNPILMNEGQFDYVSFHWYNRPF